jgi:hypothetical protein
VNECLCCHLMKADPPLDRTDKAQQVCPECQVHYSRPEQKNRDHLRAWQAVAADLEGRRRAAVARAVAAEKLAEDNRVALNDAMRVSVERFFQDGNIGDELRKRLGVGVNDEGVRLAGRAFRQRARAMNAILFVADKHSDDSDTGTCKCGHRTSRCSEFRAIRSELPGAYEWERGQITRMDKGFDHELRADHPSAKEWIARHQHERWRGLPARDENANARSSRQR